MLLRAFTILNREFGAMVQAAKAHDALIFDPNRLFIPDLDGGNGTIPRAQPAADAGILYAEMTCPAHGVVFQTVKRFCEKQRRFVLHKITAGTILYCADDTVDLWLCGFIDALHFAFVAQIIYGRPSVRHFHAELRRDGKTVGFQKILGKFPGLPRRRAIGCGEPKVIRLCTQRQLLQEFPDNARQAPGVGRADDSNRFIRFIKGKAITFAAVGNRQGFIARYGGNAVGNILTVSRCGKIENHILISLTQARNFHKQRVRNKLCKQPIALIERPGGVDRPTALCRFQ